MRRVVIPVAACVLTGVALWFSRGAIAAIGGNPTARIGLLPPLWQLVLLTLAGAAVAFIVRPGASRVLPLFFAAVLLLPWIPGVIPAAFLIWTGAVTIAVYVAIGVGLLTVWTSDRWAGTDSRWLRDAARAPLLAGIVALAAYLAAAWQLAPRLPGGDEPHYLVITQSLILDGDLQIENNHRRGDYRAYFPGRLQPDYLRRGRNGQIYSVHAPGLPALLVPAFAIGGYKASILFLSIVAAAATALAWRLAFIVSGSASAAWFGWAAVALSPPFLFHAFTIYPDGPASALVLTGVWGLLRTAAPVAEPVVARRHAGHREIDPDGADPPIAASALSPAWHDGTWTWMLYGLAIGMLWWLHTRYVLLAGVLGALLLLRIAGGPNPLRRAGAFLVAPTISAVAWIGSFVAIYGDWSPSAPYGGYTQSAIAHIRTGLPALLFDQQFGLVANAPVYWVAFAGICVMSRQRDISPTTSSRPFSRLALELTIIVLPYLLLSSAYRMWWGGTSAPARFAVPVLLPLAVPAAAAWARFRTDATRAVAISALAASVFLTAVFLSVDHGALVYNVRDGYALWLEWINRVVDLPMAAPSFFRARPESALMRVAIWAAALLAAWWLLLQGERRWNWTRGSLVLATLVLLSGAVMTAATIEWTLDIATSVTSDSAALDLLRRYDPRVRPLGVQYRPLRMTSAALVPPQLQIAPSTRRMRPIEETVLFVPSMPAGSYRLQTGGVAAGTISLGIGRLLPRAPPPTPIIHFNLDGASRNGELFELPVDANSVFFVADDRARRSVRAVSLQPVRLTRPSDRLSTHPARRAIRYGETIVYGLDDRSYLEPGGFWISPGVPAELVFQHANPTGGLKLLVRNGPIINRLEIEAGPWRMNLDLVPQEEREAEVPVAHNRPSILIRFVALRGFRPAEIDLRSQDARLLGCWVEVR